MNHGLSVNVLLFPFANFNEEAHDHGPKVDGQGEVEDGRHEHDVVSDLLLLGVGAQVDVPDVMAMLSEIVDVLDEEADEDKDEADQAVDHPGQESKSFAFVGAVEEDGGEHQIQEAPDEDFVEVRIAVLVVPEDDVVEGVDNCVDESKNGNHPASTLQGIAEAASFQSTHFKDLCSIHKYFIVKHR